MSPIKLNELSVWIIYVVGPCHLLLFLFLSCQTVINPVIGLPSSRPFWSCLTGIWATDMMRQMFLKHFTQIPRRSQEVLQVIPWRIFCLPTEDVRPSLKQKRPSEPGCHPSAEWGPVHPLTLSHLLTGRVPLPRQKMVSIVHRTHAVVWIQHRLGDF